VRCNIVAFTPGSFLKRHAGGVDGLFK
jgi:hypothetical protein